MVAVYGEENDGQQTTARYIQRRELKVGEELGGKWWCGVAADQGRSVMLFWLIDAYEVIV